MGDPRTGYYCPICWHTPATHIAGQCYACWEWCGYHVLGEGNVYGLKEGWHPAEVVAQAIRVWEDLYGPASA